MHHGVVGKGSEQTHQAQVLAIGGVMAGGAVGNLASGGKRCATDVAQVGVTRRAAWAATTGRDEPEHDMVADFEADDAGTELHHDTGTLVSADQRHR